MAAGWIKSPMAKRKAVKIFNDAKNLLGQSFIDKSKTIAKEILNKRGAICE